MSDWKDILSDDDHGLSDEELLKYLDPLLPEAEKHTIEKKMLNSDFDNEALDGLADFDNAGKLKDYVHQLNSKLKQQLTQKKQRKEKREIKNISLIVLAIVIIIALCILGFVMVNMHRKNQQKTPPTSVLVSQQAQQVLYFHALITDLIVFIFPLFKYF